MGLSRTKHYKPNTATLRHAIKHLSRANIELAIKDLMSDKEAGLAVARSVGRLISDNEIKYISSPSTLSDLRNIHDLQQIQHFSWTSVLTDIAGTAPMLLVLLESVIPQHKKDTLMPCICLIVAMIAKARNKQLNIVQQLISLVLYAGHITKQVRTCTYIYISPPQNTQDYGNNIIPAYYFRH